MSGPEIQANAIWTALHGVPLRDPPAGPALLALLLLGPLPALAHLRAARVQAARRPPVGVASLASRSSRSTHGVVADGRRAAARARARHATAR